MSNNFLLDDINQEELNTLYQKNKENYQKIYLKLQKFNESEKVKFLTKLISQLLHDDIEKTYNWKQKTNEYKIYTRSHFENNDMLILNNHSTYSDYNINKRNMDTLTSSEVYSSVYLTLEGDSKSNSLESSSFLLK